MSNNDKNLQKFSDTDFSDPNILSHKPFNHRRTTIIVTFANPSITLVDIQTIMETGMNVVRFLPCKGTSGDKIELKRKIDKATKYLAQKHQVTEWPCATCIQLKTCIVKTGILEENSTHPVILQNNTEVTLIYDVTQYDKCNTKQIFIDNPYITTEVKVGMEISLRHESIILQVKEICETKVICTVMKAGRLKNMDPVCMRGAKRTRPYLTKKDLELVKLALEYKVEMITVEYVRHPNTVKRLKKVMGPRVKRPFIACGICTKEGLCNLDDIIKEADGIIIPREFLPYELDRKMFYRMDRIQKCIIGKCRQAGKPVYISGQIFESLFKTDVLQAQDVTDISNCLLQGVSGFILKPCDNPEKIKNVIIELTELCTQIEPFTNDKIDFRRTVDEIQMPINAAMGAVMSCVLMANETQARMIVIPTVSGRTVYHLNSLRAICLVLAVTTNTRTFRSLQINRSVVPILYNGAPASNWQNTIKDRLNFAIEYALNKNWLEYGNYYVTLQKGAELSAYCDTVCIFSVTTHKKTLISDKGDGVESEYKRFKHQKNVNFIDCGSPENVIPTVFTEQPLVEAARR